MNKGILGKQDNEIGEYIKRNKKVNSYYHKNLYKLYKSIIPEKTDILEVGCATGDLLAALNPHQGLGIDICKIAISLAKEKYPHLSFQVTGIDGLKTEDRFDYVVLSNLLDYLDDIFVFLSSLKEYLKADTKIIITTVNPIWQPVIKFAEKLKIKPPDKKRNFITNKDIENMLSILDYDVIESGYRLLLPFYIPLISGLINKLFARMPLIKNFCILQYIVTKIKKPYKDFSCSVVIPCYNEEDNIEECVKGIPQIGAYTEIIVVDDGSIDKTANIVQNICRKNKSIKFISYKPNRGKGFALKTAFEQCSGDVIIILDADMSVSPGQLPRFFFPILEGNAEFINGTRMVYPMQSKAMNFTRLVGNKVFGIIMSIFIGQRNTDVLCGTKSFLRKYLPHISMGRCKWGDFDLLLGASRLKLKMIEMPVHYQIRKYGKSKMKIFGDSLHFLKVLWLGFMEL